VYHLTTLLLSPFSLVI